MVNRETNPVNRNKRAAARAARVNAALACALARSASFGAKLAADRARWRMVDAKNALGRMPPYSRAKQGARAALASAKVEWRAALQAMKEAQRKVTAALAAARAIRNGTLHDPDPDNF